MWAEADMVPKENGFNQSEKTSCCCARTSWRLPGSPTREWIVKLYKGNIFVITDTQFAIQRQVT